MCIYGLFYSVVCLLVHVYVCVSLDVHLCVYIHSPMSRALVSVPLMAAPYLPHTHFTPETKPLS